MIHRAKATPHTLNKDKKIYGKRNLNPIYSFIICFLLFLLGFSFSGAFQEKMRYCKRFDVFLWLKSKYVQDMYHSLLSLIKIMTTADKNNSIQAKNGPVVRDFLTTTDGLFYFFFVSSCLCGKWYNNDTFLIFFFCWTHTFMFYSTILDNMHNCLHLLFIDFYFIPFDFFLCWFDIA